MKYGLEIAMHEMFGRPMWTQPNYQAFEDYCVETGRSPEAMKAYSTTVGTT
jgi:hypothetical protein